MRVYQGSLFGTSELCGRKLIERKYLDDVTWIDRATGWLSGADELLTASLPWRAGRRPVFGRLVDEPRLHPVLLPISSLLDLHSAPLSTRSKPATARVSPPGSSTTTAMGPTAWPGTPTALGSTRATRSSRSLAMSAHAAFVCSRWMGASYRLVLHSGDLLVMGGACQHAWEHTVPKMRSAPPRMSLTYRHVPDRPEGAWWSRAVHALDPVAHE